MADEYSVDAAAEALGGGFPMTTGKALIGLIEAFPALGLALSDGLAVLAEDVDELGGPMLAGTTGHVKDMATHALAFRTSAESAAEAIAVEAQFWAADDG